MNDQERQAVRTIAGQLYAMKERSAALTAHYASESDVEAERLIEEAGEWLKVAAYSDNPDAVDYLVKNAKACLPVFQR